MEYSDSSGNVEQADPSQSITNTSNSQIVVAERGVLVVHPQQISHLQVLSKPKSRKLMLVSLLSTGAVAVLIGGAVRWQYALTHEVTDKAYVATDTYAVNTRIPGQVVSVTATENQVVKKGSVLVKLNPLEYQAKVKQAQISLEQAQQQVKKATTNRDTAKAKIKNQSKIQIPGKNDAAVVAARSQLKAAQSELKPVFAAFAKAELDYEHFVKLHQSGNTPLKILQDSRTKYDNLFKQHNSSIEKVRLARTKLTTAQQNYLDGQIKSAQQKVEDARKSSQEAKAKLQQKLELDSKKLLYDKAKLQQKMQEDSKKRQEEQTKLQQKIEQDSKKVLEAQAKLKKKPNQAQTSKSSDQQKLEKLQADQRKAEKLQADELKANQQKLEKLKLDHQKALIQLDKQFAVKQEQQNKTITRLTTQKQVVTQQAEAESLVLDYEKSQIYLKTAQTGLKQAQTRLKNAEYQLYYTKITAPNNGQINIKRTQAGQKVEPGQTLMSLVPQKPWIAADFEEEQLKKIKPGQSVQIQLKALTDKTFTGKVQSVLPPSKAQYNHLRPPVKISFDPKTLGKYKLLITPGTPASVKIEL
ncbi:MAG: HlyD family efflux transporter periplasmic adaptor subunit [Calothrix sp. FI2-JRJ7]|jgi:multidrug resistance efflux pump|nr:HlyD family efflux transporter periplasmic adaptor subunit [Calothrix sp. FI2-JRJ7]